MYAAGNDHAECVRLLIDAGADKDAKDWVRVVRCLEYLPFRLLFQPFLHYSSSI
jgi:hypothetical protein